MGAGKINELLDELKKELLAQDDSDFVLRLFGEPTEENTYPGVDAFLETLEGKVGEGSAADLIFRLFMSLAKRGTIMVGVNVFKIDDKEDEGQEFPFSFDEATYDYFGAYFSTDEEIPLHDGLDMLMSFKIKGRD